MSELFQFLDIETSSLCRRRCPTCIRNSHPNKFFTAPWFKQTYLPMTLISDIVDQSIQLGFKGSVCLSYFNEPLLDTRITEIARMVRLHPEFFMVYLVTNGDYMTEELAEGLDGVLNKIIVSLYMDEPEKSKRAKWIKSMFHNTKMEIILDSKHITSHYSPNPDLQGRISEKITTSCGEAKLHCIINHRRQYALCCEDVIGNFNLGFFPEMGIKEYWFGEHHQSIINQLGATNSRYGFPYCSICPK